jgi:hypothetical protein
MTPPAAAPAPIAARAPAAISGPIPGMTIAHAELRAGHDAGLGIFLGVDLFAGIGRVGDQRRMIACQIIGEQRDILARRAGLKNIGDRRAGICVMVVERNDCSFGHDRSPVQGHRRLYSLRYVNGTAAG